jgi:FtsH-binding integral membrane protein
MAVKQDISRDKTMGDLTREAFLFLTHTLVALLLLAIVIGVMSLNNPDPDSTTPKLLATILAFVVPLIGSFLLARIHRSSIATYTWISAVVFFSIICIRVLDLPTGNGLCESCTSVEKIWRTFFTFSHGSGLMGGDGLLIGAWIPLSLIGYAIGAKIAIKS